MTIYKLTSTESQKDIDEGEEDTYISWSDFDQCMQKKPTIRAKFLPDNYLLYNVLQNRRKEKEMQIYDHEEFDDFRV